LFRLTNGSRIQEAPPRMQGHFGDEYARNDAKHGVEK
jgi:hypothetical protein